MKQLFLALLLSFSVTGTARAECGPYIDLFDPYIYGFEVMHSPKESSEARTDAANAMGYMLQEVSTAAKGRELATLQACTRDLFIAMGQDLLADAELAYTLGWAGVLKADNTFGATPESMRENVAEMLAEAEKIAAEADELARVLSDEPVAQGSGIVGNWRGVQLTIVIEGNPQVKDIAASRMSLDADGTYRLALNESETETGRWDLEGTVLSLAQPGSTSAILNYSVAIADDRMQWDVTKHDGQWKETWIWQRRGE